MKKFLNKFLLFFILISSFYMVGCKKSEFKLTTSFSVIDKEVGDSFSIDEFYELSDNKAKVIIEYDNEIISISDNVITCLSAGDVNITIIAKFKEKTKSITILLKIKQKYIYATDIICATDKLYMNLNEESEINLNYLVIPNNFNQSIVIESFNTNICEYDIINSKIKGLSRGECELIIKAQSDIDSFLEKRIKVIVDDNIYPTSIDLLNGENSFNIFTNTLGKINYTFDNKNTTIVPVFTTESKLLSLSKTGEFSVGDLTGIADINVRYYINYFEYVDMKISANIVNYVEIENIKIYDNNNDLTTNFLVGDRFDYILEISFDNLFDKSNLILPSCIKIIEDLSCDIKTYKAKISFIKEDFSDLCIVYNNTGYCCNYNSEFELSNLKVVDINNCELELKNGPNNLEINENEKYNLYLFDTSKYSGSEIFNFIELNLKTDKNLLNEYLKIETDNNIIKIEDLKVTANCEGDSLVRVYLFNLLIFELNFKVEEIKATDILVDEFNDVLYINYSELTLDIILDIPYAYNNKILIEEMDTNCLVISDFTIKAINYYDDKIKLKISCGSLVEYIELKTKYLPNKIECYNFENLNLISDEIIVEKGNEICLNFKILYNDIQIFSESMKIRYFIYDENKNIVYCDSEILSPYTNDSTFKDMITIETLSSGFQYVEFSLISNPELVIIIKIIVE